MRGLVRRARWPHGLLAAAAAVLVLAGCSSDGSSPPRTQASTATRTVIHTAAPPTGPVAAGPTSSAKGTCPYITTQRVAHDLGMRLGRATVQRSGGEVIGCTFYPLAHPTAQCPAACFEGENLPPASQPVLKLLITRYPDATAAHNAMVRTARAGSNIQQVTIGDSTGLAFQTDFYPRDKGKDWAVILTRGAKLVRVDTVVTSGSLSVVTAAEHLVTKIR